jgi:hypothetical protein
VRGSRCSEPYLFSVIGILLPVGAGVWFAPRGDGGIFAVVSQSVAELNRSGSLMLQPSRQLLGSRETTARPARLRRRRTQAGKAPSARRVCVRSSDPLRHILAHRQLRRMIRQKRYLQTPARGAERMADQERRRERRAWDTCRVVDRNSIVDSAGVWFTPRIEGNASAVLSPTQDVTDDCGGGEAPTISDQWVRRYACGICRRPRVAPSDPPKLAPARQRARTTDVGRAPESPIVRYH